MARSTLDEENTELRRILEELLARDQDITARQVARMHSGLSSASTITRHPKRREIVKSFQDRQAELRLWKNRLGKSSKEDAAAKLAIQQIRIADLEQTVNVLTIGHLAMIAAVAEVGGMGKLAKFYENFRDVRNRLQAAGAISDRFSTPPTPESLNQIAKARPGKS
jgi:hypothetical protein